MLLVYGAYGFTGALVAREAALRGLPAVLAGRDEARLAPLARGLGLPHRAFPLDDPGALARGLEGARAVLHCAGPFSRTAAPVADACLAAGVHYLDITGEGAVFEAIAARGAAAERAGVTLLPGAGFDVVPSDCLAAHLVRRLPGARSLSLAFSGVRASRGTLRTALESAGEGARARRGGALERIGYAERELDLGAGPRRCFAISWGDLWTAPRSTGLPDVTVYVAAPRATRLLARLAEPFGPVLASEPVQAALRRAVDRLPEGPTPEEQRTSRARLWGEVRDAQGRTAAARLETPEAYTLTARAAVACAARVLAGGVPAGWQTPATAFGPDFVLGIPGVERVDVG
jgi:short subunit dehydrogenase-like uncharacterized protein